VDSIIRNSSTLTDATIRNIFSYTSTITDCIIRKLLRFSNYLWITQSLTHEFFISDLHIV